jgi:hypothetical protein
MFFASHFSAETTTSLMPGRVLTVGAGRPRKWEWGPRSEIDRALASVRSPVNLGSPIYSYYHTGGTISHRRNEISELDVRNDLIFLSF